MANLKTSRKLQFWACLAFGTLVSGLAADWQPYQARYSVYRNGKLIGKADITFQQKGERWSILNEGSGTHGLARILRAKNTEYAEGSMLDGRFQPELFTHHTRVAGIDDRWSADFDWPNSIINISKGKKVLPLTMQNRALDALSLKLELQRRLRDNDPDMTVYLVDEDKITQQTFKVLPDERLETSLGCLHTTPVERVRQGSTRYTRAWHAPELEFVTVRMEHGKTDGNKIEMRITELVFNDQRVDPAPGCAAWQNSQANP
jgi:hypothetical protein